VEHFYQKLGKLEISPQSPHHRLRLVVEDRREDPDRAEAAMRHHLKEVLKTIHELAAEMPAIFA